VPARIPGRWIWGVLALVLVTLVGAVLLRTWAGSSTGVALAYPEGCAAFQLSARRCDYIVAWAREQARFSPTEPADIRLLGDPDCRDGAMHCVVNRTQGFAVRVRITSPSGRSGEASVFCGIGAPYTLLCTDPPTIRTLTPTSNGYQDVPCSGSEAPGGCASPVPRPDAGGRAAAQPLEVPRIRIPIDHVGSFAVPVGQATLPNGILSKAAFALANSSPTDVLVAGDGMSLRVESLEGGPPFENIHDHGWHPGGERVRATLVFDIEWFEAGAVLEVDDIVVR
jgi:hypothetical protein